MKVLSLETEGFRNLAHTVWNPCEQVNVLYGENAQGKTNLLEALWLFTGGRSFRRAKDSELIGLGRPSARLSADFFAENRPQTAELWVDPRRRVALNGVPQASASALTGHFTAVVFSPDHLSLVKDGPEGRRRFLDAAICQIRPAYVPILSEYTHTLMQRNALLKAGRFDRFGGYHAELLRTFTERLALAGGALLQYRLTYIDRLLPLAQEVYDGLSGGRERLMVAYEPHRGYESRSREALAQALAEQWEQSFLADREAGFTTAGPHREDLLLTVNDIAARTFGSQGQQRSVVLALKMAETFLLKEVSGEYPIVLLDDVMSELDTLRQTYLLQHLQGRQVFITCCDPVAIQRIAEGRLFRMQNGVLTEEP